jgi:hypothetical protein
MALYIDDYTIVDTSYLVHACMVNPDHDAPPRTPYLLCILLHVGDLVHPCAIEYPTRASRDTAFEALLALVREERDAAEAEREEGEE